MISYRTKTGTIPGTAVLRTRVYKQSTAVFIFIHEVSYEQECEVVVISMTAVGKREQASRGIYIYTHHMYFCRINTAIQQYFNPHLLDCISSALGGRGSERVSVMPHLCSAATAVVRGNRSASGRRNGGVASGIPFILHRHEEIRAARGVTCCVHLFYASRQFALQKVWEQEVYCNCCTCSWLWLGCGRCAAVQGDLMISPNLTF